VLHPRDIVVMNRPSLDKFCKLMRPGGYAVVNKSLIPVDPDRDDVRVVNVEANRIAIDAGSAKSANMVILGAYVGATEVVPYDALVKTAEKVLQKKPKLIPTNLRCLQQGFELGKQARDA
jgi:2-oxoglutarate ferredoxin oxidoreductase subunit gamma